MSAAASFTLRIVEAIEALYHNRLVEHVERLAHHALQGEVWEKAVRYLHQAGTKVLLRSANRDGGQVLQPGGRRARHLPETQDTIASLLDLRFDLRNALVPLGEVERMGALLDEARALAEAVGDQHRLGRALTYQVLQFWIAGDYTAALEAGLRARAIGESLDNVSLQVVAELYLGRTYLARGECHEAVRHCEAALTLIPETMVQERFGQAAIPASFVGTTLAIALGALGRFDEAFGHLREAMRIAEEAEQFIRFFSRSLAFGTLKLDQGDFPGAVAPLERGFELVQGQRGTRNAPRLHRGAGGSVLRDGRRAEGTRHDGGCRSWLRRAEAEVAVVGRPHRGVGNGLPHRRAVCGCHPDRPGRARRSAQARGTGVESQILRFLGDIAAHPDHFVLTTATERYRQALVLGEALGLRPLVAHCHLSIGTLYRRTESAIRLATTSSPQRRCITR